MLREFTFIVTNVLNGCTAITNVVVTEDVVLPDFNAGPDLALPCGGGLVTLAGNGEAFPNFTISWSGPGIISGANTLNPIVNAPGTYVLLATNTVNGCTVTDAVNVTAIGSGLCSTIEGRVLQDTLENCTTDAGEPPLVGWIVKAEGALETFYGVTDSSGNYQIYVATGSFYAISAVPPSVLWEQCTPFQAINVADPNVTYFAADLKIQKLAGCPLLSVDLSSGNLRRCFSNNFFNVSYCNNGTEPAEDAYVVITLDPLLSIVSSNIPYTDLGSGVLNFEVGDLAVGECGSFYFYTLLSCDAALGQTHCTEAHIYPDTTCIPTNAQWSGASLKITSECDPDSVRFRIENVGGGNMTNAQEYIIIEDQVMIMTAPIQLDAGEFVTVGVPANGSTWRLEVEQEPFHPGLSAPALSVEACTTGPTFSMGFVTQFPPDDADEFVDIHCLENTGSYDPNDKQGFPKGYGSAHYIRPGTPLEYLIRFQNTGNDTAFTVRIVDTLSAWLDPSSIRPGASSHPYTWDLTGYGALSFLFENILLPDSNVNEPLSHGFVKFTINHQATAPLETVIENTAEIYFDFNDAIVTNTTFHRLGEDFVTVGLWQPKQPEYEVLVSPNPFSDAAILEIKGLRQNSALRLQVFDLQGKLQMEMDSEAPVFQLKKGRLAAGVYLFKIEQGGVTVGNGKLVIQD
ncbi:MAG: T9SS type A sorting domain-containing protein [Lewinellaceae bacterium]|nr:T9SS type A sorting domain-containing protein [Lewinellaceae bacterium]